MNKASESSDQELIQLNTNKDVDLMSIEEIESVASLLVNEFEHEKAAMIYDKALIKHPNCTSILDGYGELLMTIGDLGKAKTLLLKSVSLNANHGSKKHLLLGQILEGKESINAYKQALEILTKDLANSNDKSEIKAISQQIAKAHAAIAEVYMTDCCYEENAETYCENHLAEAIKQDENSVDALQNYANLRILRARDEEAATFLKKVVAIIVGIKQNDNEHSEISPQFMTQTARLLIELKLFEKGIKVLNLIIKEKDEDPEVWYLLSFANFNLKKYSNAKLCAQNAMEILSKPQFFDEEIKEATQELIAKIPKIVEEDDDEYETVSEDSMVDDEEDKEEDDIEMKNSS